MQTKQKCKHITQAQAPITPARRALTPAKHTRDSHHETDTRMQLTGTEELAERRGLDTTITKLAIIIAKRNEKGCSERRRRRQKTHGNYTLPTTTTATVTKDI